MKKALTAIIACLTAFPLATSAFADIAEPPRIVSSGVSLWLLAMVAVVVVAAIVVLILAIGKKRRQSAAAARSAAVEKAEKKS